MTVVFETMEDDATSSVKDLYSESKTTNYTWLSKAVKLALIFIFFFLVCFGIGYGIGSSVTSSVILILKVIDQRRVEILLMVLMQFYFLFLLFKGC